jgi:hypothetical protein
MTDSTAFYSQVKQILLPHISCSTESLLHYHTLSRNTAIMLKSEDLTRRGRVVNTCASYSGGPVFKSRHGDGLF